MPFSSNIEDENFITSDFLITNDIDTYVIKTEANYMTIYNMDCNEKVTIDFKEPIDNPPYVNTDLIKEKLDKMTYSTYTEEDLKNDGFLYTYHDLEKEKEIKKSK